MTQTGKTQVMSTDKDHIDAFLRHLELAGHPPTTRRTYGKVLRLASRQMPAGLLAIPDEVTAWLITRPNRSTRATYSATLRSFYRWCVRTGRLLPAHDPVADLPAPRRRRGVPRPCTHDQLELILTEAREPVRTWSHFMAYAGARCIEVSRLAREDIEDDLIRLLGKGDKERIVPTHPVLWTLAADLPPGRLTTCSADNISQRTSREYRRLGLPDWVTAHKLRHWCGTATLESSGGNTRVVQEILGHASLTETQVYTQVSNSALRAAIHSLPTISGATAAAATPAGAPAR